MALVKNRIQVCNILAKKEINCALFSKSYTRNLFDLETSLSLIIDTYSTFEFCNKKFSRYFLGKAFSQNNYLFNNSHNYEFRLSTPINNNLNVVDSFYKALLNLFLSKLKFAAFLLLNPKKGGFKCYFSGLLGFLPKSQAQLYFKILIIKLQKVWNNISSVELLQFFTQSNSLFIFRLNFFCDSVKILPCYKTKKFHFSSYGRINFVFIYYKIVRDVKNKEDIKNCFAK